MSNNERDPKEVVAHDRNGTPLFDGDYVRAAHTARSGGVRGWSIEQVKVIGPKGSGMRALACPRTGTLSPFLLSEELIEKIPDDELARWQLGEAEQVVPIDHRPFFDFGGDDG